MPAYAALDVSKKSTSIHVVDETGTCLWRGKTATDPDAIAEALAPFGGALAKVGLETGCWSIWLCHELRGRGLPVVCMDARQAHAALSLSINKTDANDARGLAQLLRAGLFREVRVKSWDDVRLRALIHARRALAGADRPRKRHSWLPEDLRADAWGRLGQRRRSGLRAARPGAPRRPTRPGAYRSADAGGLA